VDCLYGFPVPQKDFQKALCGASFIRMDGRGMMPRVVEQLRKLEEYGLENEKKYPWMPSAWNKAN
jgi:hypothetical protein